VKMTTVTEAFLALLGRCDGAATKDYQGFNGRDAGFARSLGEWIDERGSLTPQQERAMYKILKKYKGQLSGMGFEYNDLVVEATEVLKESSKIYIVNTQYGPKISLKFQYDKSVVSKLKDLPWDRTHRRWDPDGEVWRLDANDFSVEALEGMGFEVPKSVKDECGVAPEEETGPRRILWGNTFSKISGGLQKKVNQALRNKIGFQPPGYEYSPKYQSGEWDGWISLYQTGLQKFPSGLLSMVEEVFNEFEIEYEVIDQRDMVGEKLELEWNGPELRDYQWEVVEKAMKAEKGFIVMPTGSGKTMVALQMIYQFRYRTVIFVQRKELLYQWASVLENILSITPGIVGDGQYEEKDITVAMLQTVHGKPLQNDYDVMFCDEGHHMPAETFQASAERINAKYRYSLSATMRREDGKEILLWSQTGTLIANVTVADLVEWGYLAKPNFVILKHDDYFSGKDYNAEVREMIKSESRNRAIVDYTEKMHKEGHKCYVDVKRIKHGKDLAEMLNARGVKAIFISGGSSTKVRQETLKTFEEDGFVLVSTLIKEGVDLPAMSLVVLAGGGKSGTVVVQTIGRALRPKSIGENEAFVADCADEGRFSTDHSSHRQGIMKDYYGDLYTPSEVEA